MDPATQLNTESPVSTDNATVLNAGEVSGAEKLAKLLREQLGELGDDKDDKEKKDALALLSQLSKVSEKLNGLVQHMEGGKASAKVQEEEEDSTAAVIEILQNSLNLREDLLRMFCFLH